MTTYNKETAPMIDAMVAHLYEKGFTREELVATYKECAERYAPICDINRGLFDEIARYAKSISDDEVTFNTLLCGIDYTRL